MLTSLHKVATASGVFVKQKTRMHGHQQDNQVGSLDEDETIRTASGTTVPQVNCEAFPPTSQHLKDKLATGH